MSSTEQAWFDWKSPRKTSEGFDTPFHHAVVEVQTDDAGGSMAINPLELSSADFENVRWRPMPWATSGSYCYASKLGPDNVFEGNDGHLFHCINSVCEQVIEGGGLTTPKCREWTNAQRRRLDWCKARGIGYRLLIVPEHQAVYPDKIPGRPKIAATRPVIRVMEAADAELRSAIIYPLKALIEGREKYETSFPHDVHFTRYGAFLCYRELMLSLPGYAPADLILEEELIRSERMVAGDVARAGGWPGRLVEWFDPPKTKSQKIIKGTSFSTTQVDVFETENTGLPRLVMFRTSNSTHLLPFLFRHFSRVTTVATTQVFYDLIESEAPDFAVAEMPERYLAMRSPRSFDDRDLCSVPYDASTGFTEVTGHELPLPVRQV